MWRELGVQYNNQFSGPRADCLALPRLWDCLPTRTNLLAQFLLELWQHRQLLVGIDRDNPKDYPDQTITATDQFSYNRGNHQLMFGFEVNNYRTDHHRDWPAWRRLQ